MGISKEPIRLRKRILPSGLTSLYLDIYLDGKRSYEYLRLYLVPEKSRTDKEKNRTTLSLAEDIRAKRMVELRNDAYGFRNNPAKDTLFLQYFDMLTAKRVKVNPSNKNSWQACRKHILIYDRHAAKKTLAEITEKWLLGFRTYLEDDAVFVSTEKRVYRDPRPIAQNTKANYWRRLATCINDAYCKGILSRNPLNQVDSIGEVESVRGYLTIDELRKLVETPCAYDNVRDAFLFSCFTGLRRSDVIGLRWGNVQRQGDFTRLVFTQQKTGGQEYLDINEQAVSLMGESKGDDDPVFTLPSMSCVNDVIAHWVKEAGLKKKITFHCARHTFATLMLDLGTDLYTVSKLLGHRQLRTTQIYAKVLDKNKQAAVARIPSILDKATPAEDENKKTQN